MKDWPDIFRHLTMLSQIGLSLAAPLLICILLCSWLCNRFSMAGWIYLPGFFFWPRRICRDGLEGVSCHYEAGEYEEKNRRRF